MAIQTLADLDNTIKVIGLLDLNIAQIESDLSVAVTVLRDKAKEQVAQVHAERSILETLCQQYVASHRNEVLQGKRSAQLNFGKVGYRRTSEKIPIPPKDKQEELCDVIEYYTYPEHSDRETAAVFKMITIHYQRSVRQTDLKPLADDQLKLIGLTREPAGEQFFLQADMEKLVEVQGA
jgi:hypothetical protein